MSLKLKDQDSRFSIDQVEVEETKQVEQTRTYRLVDLKQEIINIDKEMVAFQARRQELVNKIKEVELVAKTAKLQDIEPKEK
jgi:uncharacterized protein YlxW (UPF0749 family)